MPELKNPKWEKAKAALAAHGFELTVVWLLFELIDAIDRQDSGGLTRHDVEVAIDSARRNQGKY